MFSSKTMGATVSLVLIFLILAAPTPVQAGSPNAMEALNGKIVVAPATSSGVSLRYPRTTAFTDPAIMNRINKRLAEAERAGREQIDQCRKDLKDAHLPFDPKGFDERVTVTYLSTRYLSLYANLSYYCGGPYPVNEDIRPMTIDLTNGAEIDLRTVFTPAFIEAPSQAQAAQHSSGPAPTLLGLYAKKYRSQDPKPDPDCFDAIDGLDMGDVSLWLQSGKSGGLVMQPSLPHAMEACEATLVFSPSEIVPFISDKALATDLQRNVAAIP
jgi:hypothetical protein